MNTKRLEKAVRALLRMPAPPHVCPLTPTKVGLERKFKLRVDRRGKPRMEAV